MSSHAQKRFHNKQRRVYANQGFHDRIGRCLIATMKFCKNLQRVVDISDPEWAPYWTNYKMLKVSGVPIVFLTPLFTCIDVFDFAFYACAQSRIFIIVGSFSEFNIKECRRRRIMLCAILVLRNPGKQLQQNHLHLTMEIRNRRDESSSC